MKEQEIDYQKHLPPLGHLIKTSDFFSPPKSFRYTFPDRTEKLVNEVKLRLLRKLEEKTGPMYAAYESPIVSPTWAPLFSYLQDKGLLKSVALDPPFNDEVKLFFTYIFTQISQGSGDGHKPQHPSFSRGVSEDYDEAMSKVVGELLERYPLLLYKERDFIRASIADLESSSHSFLNPFTVAGFSKEQEAAYPEMRFDKKSIFHWTSATSLIDGGALLVPAQLVFWSYCRHHGDATEPVLRETNTNGAGGYFTRTGAILSGLYELLQRDAFLIHWFNSSPPRLIDNATVRHERARNLLDKALRLGFDISLLDVTSDFKVPAVICAVRDLSGSGPYMVLGGGCEMDAGEAIYRACSEGLGVYHWIRKHPVDFQLPADYKPFSRDPFIGQIERLILWNNPSKSLKEGSSFMFKGKREHFDVFAKQGKTFDSREEELDFLVNKFAQRGKGYEPLYYQAKHPVLDELGYASVKAIVPELIPLYMQEHHAPAGARRIKEAMVRMGKQPSKTINPLPHPFP